jgi:hypothetical protein
VGRNLISIQMIELLDDDAGKLIGGTNACLTSVVLSATIGGLFGGAGALIGAIAAATGSACLGIL